MSYPKPLSEKSLERLYKESGLTKEARTFLHVFFAACANLYGAIALRHMFLLKRTPAQDDFYHLKWRLAAEKPC